MMNEQLQQLVDGVRTWREHNISDYWLRVSYLGGELNRFGDHELTYTNGKLYHSWRGEWREIKKGSDFWLFSVPGSLNVAPSTEI